MVILGVLRVFLLVKNLEILIQIVPDRSIYYYSGFAYSACGAYTKHCESIQKFSKKGDLKHIYQNELDKACFDDDATCSNSKALAKRTISDKTLK